MSLFFTFLTFFIPIILTIFFLFWYVITNHNFVRLHLSKQYPDQPWLWRNDWINNKISYPFSLSYVMLLFSFIWLNIRVLYLIITIILNNDLNIYAYIAFSMFIFAILILIYKSSIPLTQYIFYGFSMLTLNKVPCGLHEDLHARLLLSHSCLSLIHHPFILKIQCTKILLVEGDRPKNIIKAYQTEGKIILESNQPVIQFIIPSEHFIHSTIIPYMNKRYKYEYEWKLCVQSKHKFISYYAEFVLPIFELNDGVLAITPLKKNMWKQVE